MAEVAAVLDGIFTGLYWSFLGIMVIITVFGVWYWIQFKHKIILRELSDTGGTGKAIVYSVRETKGKVGNILWQKIGAKKFRIPHPPPGFFSYTTRGGKIAEGYMQQGTMIWVKPDVHEKYYMDGKEKKNDFFHKLDLFSDSQKESYLAMEEVAVRKKLTSWDRTMQLINMGVLLFVLAVIVIGWEDMMNTPKEMADKVAGVAEKFENTAKILEKVNTRIDSIDARVEDVSPNQLPEEPPG